MNVVQRISHKQRPNSGKQTNNLSNKYKCLNEGKIKGTVHQKKPKWFPQVYFQPDFNDSNFSQSQSL